MDLDRRALLLAGAGAVTVAPLTVFAPAAAGKTRTKTFKGAFRSSDTPDWHYLPFRVPDGVRRISVKYDYEPTDTGIGISYNVVDIGIFDPDGFRGWSGGARRSFGLSRTAATPGYLPGRIRPGVWRIALGPYLITPPGTPYTVKVTLHFGRRGRRFDVAAAPTEIAGRGPGWYRADLHTHTFHSDGSRTRGRLVGSARAAGLDILGSSEHNTSSATLSWGRHAPDDLLVVSGEEVTTRAGHWLAMGIPAGTWIDWRYRPEDDQLASFTDRVRELGGVAIACHPFNPVASIRWGFGTDFPHMDAFEIWNGPWTGDDQQAVVNWTKLLNQGRFVPAVGTSDSHNDGQTVGLAQSVMRLDALSSDAVVAAVKGGHLYVAESSAVALTLRRRHRPGDGVLRRHPRGGTERPGDRDADRVRRTGVCRAADRPCRRTRRGARGRRRHLDRDDGGAGVDDPLRQGGSTPPQRRGQQPDDRPGRLTDGGVDQPGLRHFRGVTQSRISPSITTSPSSRTPRTRTGRSPPSSDRASDVHCPGSVSAMQVMSEVALAV